MTAESLGHIFIFIGIMATWLFPLWLYFHWLRDDDKMLADFAVAMGDTVAMGGTVIYFTLISHYFKFTVSVTI